MLGAGPSISSASDVTPKSLMPQGTISENSRMSGERFSAKPCIVTQREMRTPMAPSLTRSEPDSVPK